MIERIAIIGAGAIGCVVGGMLTRAGRDVTLVDQWPEHVEAMKKIGLRLSGTCGEHLVPVSISSRTDRNDYRPRLLEGREKQRVLDRVRDSSRALWSR